MKKNIIIAILLVLVVAEFFVANGWKNYFSLAMDQCMAIAEAAKVPDDLKNALRQLHAEADWKSAIKEKR